MVNVRLPEPELEPTGRPRITVIGVGGAGGNAVNNMIASNLEGVEFVVCNTDAQALKGNRSPKRIQLGIGITKGLGAGAKPDVGRMAAEEALEEILDCFEGANMVFITAGMGGGTGTGAAPVIARAARDQGILTVGVVTKPFHFEGTHRMKLAESGIAELQQYVDTLIVIPNQNLFRIATERTTFAQAFQMADQVLYSGVRGVTDLMMLPGEVNLDFADIRTIMSEMGKAMMGTGEAEGDGRAIKAAEAAIHNPLLDDVSLRGARAVLINITGGYDMTLFEVDEAANRVRQEVDPEANIIFGSTLDQAMEGKVRVSVVATGIDHPQALAAQAQAQQPIHVAPPPAQGRPLYPQAERAAAAAQPRGLTQMASHGGTAPPPLPPQGPQVGATERHAAAVAQAAQATTLPPPVPAQGPAPRPALAPAQAAPAAELRAIPRGETVGESFIPPAPLDVGPRPVPKSGGREGAAAPRAAEAPRPPGVFGAVFGQRRPAQAPVAVAPPSPQGRPGQRAVVAPPKAAQPGLGIEPQARTAEDELLDIPAFLRRQAN